MLKRSGWTFVPAAFFLALNFSSASVKPLFFSRGIYFLFLVSLFFLLRKFCLDKILRTTIGGVALIVFFYGLFQKFFLFPYYLRTITPQDNFFSQAMIIRVKSGRIFSLFTLPTLYAIVCALFVLFILHYFLNTPSFKAKVFWAFLGFLGMVNLILTQSFGGVLYLSAGVLLYLLLMRVIKLKYLAPVAMVMALFFFLVVGLRFSEARQLEPVKLRLTNWHQALRMIGDYPFLGAGLGNYESGISYYTQGGEARSIYAHNFFLQFSAETGVLIPLFILLIMFVSRKKLRPKDVLGSGLYISAFFILLIYNLIDIGFYFFSAGVAGVICLSQMYPGKKEGHSWIGMAVTALLGVLLLVETVADTYQQHGDYWFHQKDYTQAESNYQKSLALNPFNIRSIHGSASLCYARGDLDSSSKYLHRVLALHPGSAPGNYLVSRIELQRGKYFSAFYYAYLAHSKNTINRQFKRWYESIKDKLQVELAQPQD